MTKQQIEDKIKELDAFLIQYPNSEYRSLTLQDKQDLQTKLDTKDYE